MSMHMYSYLGPYLKVEQKTRVEQRLVRTCPNTRCMGHGPEHTSDAFCRRCGTEVKDGSYPVSVGALDADDLFGSSIWVMLTHGGFQYLTPNENRGRPARLQPGNDSDGEEGVVAIPVDSVATELAWFETAFAVEIAKAREVYGDDGTSVHWGLINHVR